jgi:hypothetical protein
MIFLAGVEKRGVSVLNVRPIRKAAIGLSMGCGQLSLLIMSRKYLKRLE